MFVTTLLRKSIVCVRAVVDEKSDRTKPKLGWAPAATVPSMLMVL
jgi:hypothetical protein